MRALAVALAALALAAPAAGGGFPVGVDLATGKVNGKVVLGRTPAQVVAFFGRPDSFVRTAGLTYMRYGPPLTFSLTVLFGQRGGRLVATAAAFQNPALVEVRLGRLLALRPPAIQQAVRRAYGRAYKLAEPYKCVGGQECSGRFDALDGKRHVSFGLAAGHSFLNVWQA